MKALIAPFVVGSLALGGCIPTTKIDASIASADSKLREQCFLLQGASVLAVAIKDNDTTRTIDDAISLYCTSARVDNALTAAQRVAEIYKLVSRRLRK